jgi:hypothetical protein
MATIRCTGCGGTGYKVVQKAFVDSKGKAGTRTETERCKQCYGTGQMPGH